MPDEARKPAGSPSFRIRKGKGCLDFHSGLHRLRDPQASRFCRALLRVPKLYVPGDPQAPLSNFCFQIEVPFSIRGLGGIRQDQWLLCTEQWESVRGLPPRDGTVKCVDTRPCSRALCGLGVFICGPDLPLRGGGGWRDREGV